MADGRRPAVRRGECAVNLRKVKKIRFAIDSYGFLDILTGFCKLNKSKSA
jgi:hypothetical protein